MFLIFCSTLFTPGPWEIYRCDLNRNTMCTVIDITRFQNAVSECSRQYWHLYGIGKKYARGWILPPSLKHTLISLLYSHLISLGFLHVFCSNVIIDAVKKRLSSYVVFVNYGFYIMTLNFSKFP